MTIKDSGKRRKFETGAVRDIAEDKGRCDLLPLDVLSTVIGDTIINHINSYVRHGNINEIIEVIKLFSMRRYGSIPEAFLELSKHYEEGTKKYTERNWEKGIPAHCYVDSGIRHYLKFKRSDKDEPHDRAFLWNMVGLAWTHFNLPEMLDLPFGERK